MQPDLLLFLPLHHLSSHYGSSPGFSNEEIEYSKKYTILIIYSRCIYRPSYWCYRISSRLIASMNQSRIFVVEDDADDREFLQDALELLDCTNELVFFYSYEELLECLESLPVDKLPHLIVLENHIQSINAAVTVHQLLSNIRLLPVKLAIYTASLPACICERYTRQGVHLCVEKGSNMVAVNEDASQFCQLAARAQESKRPL
jgi:CheY-like chemotaxis protein